MGKMGQPMRRRWSSKRALYRRVAAHAQEDLIRLWVDAADPGNVEQAANWIDRQLRDDPLQKVTPVDAFYSLRRDPLAVLCQISVDDRIVEVIEVHRK